MNADKQADNRLARLIEEIELEVRETSRLTGRATLNPRVIEAMRRVPRHKCVPEDIVYRAYDDTALPIGHGQTISQPYVVALMTDLLDLDEQSVVLEIGTGCGYQAAVLAELAKTVYSVEFVEALAAGSQARLAALGYHNVHVKCGNGRQGWPEHGPFDGIIVTAAAESIPASLTDQLKTNKKLVIPIGPVWGSQVLVEATKAGSGELAIHQVLPVAFVPLIEPAPD